MPEGKKEHPRQGDFLAAFRQPHPPIPVRIICSRCSTDSAPQLIHRIPLPGKFAAKRFARICDDCYEIWLLEDLIE